MEHLDSVCQIISWLSFHAQPAISAQLWVLFDMIHVCFLRFAYDYLGEIVGPIDSYIANGLDTLVANDVRPKVGWGQGGYPVWISLVFFSFGWLTLVFFCSFGFFFG